MSFEKLLTSLQHCVITKDNAASDVTQTLELLLQKLCESSRMSVKRCKERCLDEAVQLLRRISETQLGALEDDHLLLLVRLLLSMQVQLVSISTACRKVDQMLQHVAKVDHPLVFRETLHCLEPIVYNDQVLSHEDLQRVCMFLEDSTVGREVWRQTYASLLSKVSELFTAVLPEESLRDGPLCYISVKVCLQVFQLLSTDVAPLVWDQDSRSPTMQNILQALMDIILGQCCNRDTRLLAGVAVAMMINTASESRAGGAAAWSLLQVSHSESWLLTVGGLQVQCGPSRGDGVDRLAVSRGLLTCCRPHILLSSHEDKCVLLEGLFPLVSALCEEKLDCHYFAFEALTLWMKRVKESSPDIWKMTGTPLLLDHSSLQQQLLHVIWTNADSPVEGVSEFARSAFILLLDLYEMDREHFVDPQKTFYSTLLQRIVKLPWESKAKYHRLCALLPHVGTDTVLDQYAELPHHLLKCLSTNHLSPCGAELYKGLIQQQRRELKASSHSEPELAALWAGRWQPVLHQALTSPVALLQNNCSTQLLPATFQVFPSAVDPLLASLDPCSPGHLHAWASIMSSYRAVTGAPPWALQGGSASETLRLALGSADDKVRVAALNLLCCSPKTKDTPTAEEMEIMTTFIPQNLNCESSPFRQHFQAGVKRFLVRIRDGCLARVRAQKKSKKDVVINSEEKQDELEQGIGFVDWLSQLPFGYLAPGHNYQRKKTVLLLLSAVMETCTDTWSADRKKGQPPADIGSLIEIARLRGRWDFFSRTKLLTLIGCLEDSTNEIRDLSAELLMRFFPPRFPDDITEVLRMRANQLMRSPRVPEAQTGALMMKVLLRKLDEPQEGGSLDRTGTVGCGSEAGSCSTMSVLVKELQDHYLTATADMMLAAKTKPIHGVLSALQRCLLDSPNNVCVSLDSSLTAELLDLLHNITLLLLSVLYGDSDACATEKEAPPSFCDMGNAISSLVARSSEGGQADADESQSVLLSEEHSLVLTCCWVSLKEIGIFLGSLVERILSQSKQPGLSFFTKPDLLRASEIFQNILLKCRHWGAVEGCCIGFTKFCASLLSSSDPELRDVPAQMLKQGLQVVQCVRSTSVTRRAAGLPMMILCVVSAEEASKARPLLAHSMQTLLETAQTPLNQNWDQTLDLPQVCAVHTLQALVRGSSLGVAVFHFAPAVAILSLTLLSSSCWAMRNAALQLYSSLCSRMLGQRSSGDEAGPTQHAMSPAAFFFHYPALQPFLLGELRGAAGDLQGPSDEAKLPLQPSLYPILTLLAQLQPGVQDSPECLSDFVPPLLQLSASPVYSVRVMASKALVAMSPPSEYTAILLQLLAELPSPQQRCCHNRLHGQLLQIKAVLERTSSSSSDKLSEVLSGVQAARWLATDAQRCPLVRAVYLGAAGALRPAGSCRSFLSELSHTVMQDLPKPQRGLQIGLYSFHQQAISFLSADPKYASEMWSHFSAATPDLRLSLVRWVLDGRSSLQTSVREVVQRVLQLNLREALWSPSLEYRRIYLQALVAVSEGAGGAPAHHHPPCAALQEPALSQCLDLLLEDLEDQRGGPEFLSQVLHVASLLLSQSADSSPKMWRYQRWCGVLECQRVPNAPEVLRIASAEALCMAAVPLMNHSLRETLSGIMIRVINTGLYLLQDQNQQVRMKAACFVSMCHHRRRGGSQRSVHLMQVNQALPALLDVLVEECWDVPGTLEVLLDHLPPFDLRAVLTEASASGSSSLYEQDEANVFAEPSVMAAHVLPYLLQMVEKYPQSSVLAQSLNTWGEEEGAAEVLDSLSTCKELVQRTSSATETFSPSRLALLTDPRVHSSLCGLLTRTALLLRLLETSDKPHRHLCDPSLIRTTLQEVCRLLSQRGVHFPAAVTELCSFFFFNVRSLSLGADVLTLDKIT